MIKRLIGQAFALAAVAVLVLTILHRDHYASLCPLRCRCEAVTEPADKLSVPAAPPQTGLENPTPDSAALRPTENGHIPVGEAAPGLVTAGQDDIVRTNVAPHPSGERR